MSLSNFIANNADKIFGDAGGFLRLGQVEKIHFIDDSTNISKTNVEYDIVLFDDEAGQTMLRNVRAMQKLGSSNDYSEFIYEDNQIAFEKDLDESNVPQNKNGSYVLILFMDNSFFKPFIIGAVRHPIIESEATREKGIHQVSEFRGLIQEINKDGELEITLTGTKTAEGEPEVKDQKPITFKLGIGNSVQAEGGHKLVIESGKEGDRFLLETAGGQSFQVEDTEGEEFIQILHKSESYFLFDTDGSIKIYSPTDFTFAAKTYELEAEDSITLSDGTGGALKISGGKVALGGSSAELLDLFEQLLTQMDTILTQVQAITVPTAVGPSGPPVNAAMFATAQVQVASIKTLLGGIKGSL